MSPSPAVSIVVPLYNKGRYVLETIQSVLAQTVDCYEVIVVDNGSTDDGPQKLRELSRTTPSLRVIESDGRGPGHARNWGVRRAQGEWILFLDADDLLESSHLENLLCVAKQEPDATVIAGRWQEFEDGRPSQRIVKHPAGCQSSKCLTDLTIATSPWAVHACILKRSLVEANPWPEEMDFLLAEDNAFWFRISMNAKVAYADTQSALYRTQTEGCRTQSDHLDRWYTGVHTAVETNLATLKKMGLSPTSGQAESLMRLYSGLYIRAVHERNLSIAKECLEEARTWLVRCKSKSRSVRLRRILGIATFERVLSWVK